MPFTCLLDIVGCAPQKMAPQFVDQLPFLKNQFTNTVRNDIRDTVSLIYSIILATTGTKEDIEAALADLLKNSKSSKNLETQCGYIATLSNLLERCIVLHKQKKISLFSDNFNILEWSVFKDTVEFLGNFHLQLYLFHFYVIFFLFLVECLSSAQSMIVNAACISLCLLGKIHSFPLPNGEKNTTETTDNNIPTKLVLVDKLFSVLKNAKFSLKIKERATRALGLICIGESFPHSKYIIEGFLEMAKEVSITISIENFILPIIFTVDYFQSKDFEIHLQIGESLIYCIEGINSYDNRDFWTEHLPKEKNIIRDNHALEQNDVIFNWLLDQLLSFVNVPHPNSRQVI